MPSIDDYFAAGVKRLISGGGWGKQADLARHLGVDKAYCNQMVHGHRRILDKWKDKMAEYFNKDVIEILQMGKAYMDESTAFPWMVDAAKIEKKSERATFMFIKLVQWSGFEDEELLEEFSDTRSKWERDEVDDHTYVKVLSRLIEKIMSP